LLNSQRRFNVMDSQDTSDSSDLMMPKDEKHTHLTDVNMDLKQSKTLVAGVLPKQKKGEEEPS
jgi:hypothetical protein